ncbi:MAG: fructosamine kinase family protein [Phaeodactylibacter sp.]|nr:fructosamine kinase family protein [Phaeodactylibacter sp.]MCB9274101.1 fructosamine kinase family protein [Lewinellaceae bacterium]
MLPEAVRTACSELLGSAILGSAAVGGGDINEAMLLETAQGPVFLKMNAGPQAQAMFAAETRGLALLAQSGAAKVPHVLGSGTTGRYAFLLLEYLPQGHRSRRFWEQFGAAVAALHRNPAQMFGLDTDNFIGSLPQRNRQHDTWPAFYTEERLEPQARLAADKGLLWDGAGRSFGALYRNIANICPEEPPSLIHGDLWSGNFLTGPNGEPVLIDPAVSYAHREMDLAMARLFGGFASDFYHAYEESAPTAPGLEERIPLYQLYYLLVHLNLFGAGYRQPVRDIVRAFFA